MEIKLTNQMKLDTLHKLYEEFSRQIIWIKDHDFKVFYYTMGLLVGIVAWFAANPPQNELIPLLNIVIIILGLWAALFLVRNHNRHAKLLNKIHNIYIALQLNIPNTYDGLLTEEYKNLKDWGFFIGRLLYFHGILITCIISIVIIN